MKAERTQRKQFILAVSGVKKLREDYVNYKNIALFKSERLECGGYQA